MTSTFPENLDLKVVSLTMEAWRESVEAMKVLLAEIKGNKDLNQQIIENVAKINKHIFSESQGTVNSNDTSIVNKLTDKEFNTIMNEIKQDNDHIVCNTCLLSFRYLLCSVVVLLCFLCL